MGKCTLLTCRFVAYFGDAAELIHGIHMVIINPSTGYLRPYQFVKEEWEKFFSNGRANVEGMYAAC
jgi:endo-1,3(4)-beta-glucanase